MLREFKDQRCAIPCDCAASTHFLNESLRLLIGSASCCWNELWRPLTQGLSRQLLEGREEHVICGWDLGLNKKLFVGFHLRANRLDVERSAFKHRVERPPYECWLRKLREGIEMRQTNVRSIPQSCGHRLPLGG